MRCCVRSTSTLPRRGISHAGGPFPDKDGEDRKPFVGGGLCEANNKKGARRGSVSLVSLAWNLERVEDGLNLLDVGCLGTFLAVHDFKRHLLAFGKGFESIAKNSAVVHKNILPLVSRNKTIPLALGREIGRVSCRERV